MWTTPILAKLSRTLGKDFIACNFTYFSNISSFPRLLTMLTVLLWFPLYGAIFPLPLLDCSFHNIGSFYGYESEIKGEKMEFIFFMEKILRSLTNHYTEGF